MADLSSWTRYLPPVLWAEEAASSNFSLGAALRLFEKLLTGIDDGVTIAHGDHDHEDLQEVIAGLSNILRPYQTPPEFLPWLASWVALELPSIWNDVQRRKATAEMVQIYQQRGLKRGLDRYLDIYTTHEKRPRIVVDDSAKVLFANPAPQKIATLSTLTAQSPMVAPTAIALGPDGSLFVADPGQLGLDDEEVWRVFPQGQVQFGAPPVAPQPLGPPPPAFNLTFPVALAIDNAVPWNVYVLDRPAIAAPGTPVLFRLTSPGFAAATTVATRGQIAPGGPYYPVAMALDQNGHLLVLDRGPSPQSGQPATPRIIDLDVSVSPPVRTLHPLAQVVEPLSLAVLPSGELAIGDGRDQTSAVPGDVVLVDRTNPLNWVETVLLALLPADENPLASPTAIVLEDDDHLLVADTGLKPFFPSIANPFERFIARPGRLWRVDLSAAPPTVEAAGEDKQLVSPTGMVRAPDGIVYLSDRGELSDSGFAGPLDREWRARTQEFGVVVHFLAEPPSPQLTQDRRRIITDIRQIIRKEKPAHSLWSFVYRV